MLDGDVPVETTETLLEATREFATGLQEGDEEATGRANDRLEDLETSLE